MNNDRYKDKTYVGTGGMASVYKAFDQLLQRPVAIKEMAEQFRGNEDVRALFLGEARKMAQIHHQNVVQVYDVPGDEDVPTIIMEFVAGGSLAARLSDGTMSTREVLNILKQVTAGLKAIHAAGVTHRDIKPENILHDKGIYKIADFGIALTGEEDVVPFITNKYAAPEVMTDPLSIGPKSDLYSLGIMAIELLLGPRRFEEVVREAMEGQGGLQLAAVKASPQLLWQQWVAGEAELPALRTLNSAISPELSRLLSRLTARDQNQRPQDCDAVLAELKEVIRIENERNSAQTVYDPKLKRQVDKGKADKQKDSGKEGTAKKSPLWFRLTLGFGVFLLVAVAALMLVPTGGSSFALEVVTEPPGASLTVNGTVLENLTTPARLTSQWGDKIGFQFEGRNPLEVVLVENLAGLSRAENGMKLEVVLSAPLSLTTSAEAAALLRERLPRNWPVEVKVEGFDKQQELYPIAVGAPLNFRVSSEREGTLIFIHLGADNSVTLIYPDPGGVSPRLSALQKLEVGRDVGLVATEPVGREWVVFVVGRDWKPPVDVGEGEAVGEWARRYPLAGEGSPGSEIIGRLLDSIGSNSVSGTVVDLDVVYRLGGS